MKTPVGKIIGRNVRAGTKPGGMSVSTRTLAAKHGLGGKAIRRKAQAVLERRSAIAGDAFLYGSNAANMKSISLPAKNPRTSAELKPVVAPTRESGGEFAGGD